MSPENRELKLLLNDNAAANVILTWLRNARDEAKSTYEQLAQASVFDGSKIAPMRVAYGKYKAVDDLYLEALDLTSTIGA